MDMGINGRVALVTGAGRGIGAEICRTLAAEGAKIAVNDYFAERAEEAAAELRKAGGEAMAAAFDVTDYALRGSRRESDGGVRRGRYPRQQRGDPGGDGCRCDPLHRQLLLASDRAQWDRTMGLITYGVMNCSRAVLAGMVERGGAGS